MASGNNESILNKEEITDYTVQQSLEETDNANLLDQPVEVDGKINSCNIHTTVENGFHHNIPGQDESIDELRQMVIELSSQNEYLKSQLGDLKSELLRKKPAPDQEGQSEQHVGSSEQDNNLHEQLIRFQKEIHEQKETQKAAEDALERLRIAYSEADGKVQELSAKLIEAQQRMEQEIKEREDKYVELDTKFGRLHKRAKQRIQELQKEKDDLEARFNEVTVKLEQALSQQTQAQQELERSCQQASEALKSMDVERQQLRTTNKKLRDNFDEMHRSLEAKDNDLEALHQSIFEKEQLLEQVRASLQSSEEKGHATITELSAKHQMQLENLQAQLTDALAESRKAAETISSLEIVLSEKDLKIAELDAASTGEAVRLRAALEETRGELNHLREQQDKEKQNWEAAYQAFQIKLEAAESTCLRSQIELAKLKSQLELESSTKYQILNTKEAELVAAKSETVEEKRGEPDTKMMRQTTRKVDEKETKVGKFVEKDKKVGKADEKEKKIAKNNFRQENAGGKQKGPLRQVEQTETKVVNKNHLPPRTGLKDNKKAIVTKVLKTGLNRPIFSIWIGLLRTRLWKRSSRTANRVVGEGQEGEGRRRRGRRGRRGGRRRRRREEGEEGGHVAASASGKQRARAASRGQGMLRTILWKRSIGAADRIAGEGQEGEGRRRRRRRRGEEEEEGEGGGEEKKKKERKADRWRRVRVASSGRERQAADENGKEKQGSCGRLEQQDNEVFNKEHLGPRTDPKDDEASKDKQNSWGRLEQLDIGAAKQSRKERTSEKIEVRECKFHTMPGGCKFGKSCKYVHSQTKTDVAPLELNFLGLPIRPGAKECSYYMRTGNCKFATNCKYHHPDPTEVTVGQDPLPFHGYQNRGSPIANLQPIAVEVSPVHVMSNVTHATRQGPTSFEAASPYYAGTSLDPEVFHSN